MTHVTLQRDAGGTPAGGSDHRDSVERRPPGQLESLVLDVLARAAGRDQTAQEVLDALGVELAYTTMTTTLNRLHDKGALRRARVGRAFVYRLAADADRVPAAVAARRMHRVLESEGDRAGVLTHFVGELAPGEEQVLRSLLDQAAAAAAAGAAAAESPPGPAPRP